MEEEEVRQERVQGVKLSLPKSKGQLPTPERVFSLSFKARMRRVCNMEKCVQCQQRRAGKQGFLARVWPALSSVRRTGDRLWPGERIQEREHSSSRQPRS